MSKCIDPRPLIVCFSPNDGSTPVKLIKHIFYEDGVAVGQGYTTFDDVETIVDPATYLGGGTISGGDCIDSQTASDSGVELYQADPTTFTVPANTYEVTILNNSNANIRVDIGTDFVFVPRRSSMNINRNPDRDVPYATTGTYAITAGSFGGGVRNIAINFKTVI